MMSSSLDLIMVYFDEAWPEINPPQNFLFKKLIYL